MKYPDVMKYCLSLPDSERESLSPHAIALRARDRVFGYFETGAPIQWQFSLRVSPQQFHELPSPPQIRQAKERQDDHWITIQRVENFDEDLLKALINGSYQRALQ